jgi:hypothetical protein
MKREKIFLIIFSVIIILPITSTFLFSITGKNIDIKLKGNFDSYEKPKLSLHDYADGKFQTDYENWINTNLIPRGRYIKLYNQIEYSCFKQGNRIIGRNDNIFGEVYVEDVINLNDATDFTIPENANALTSYVDHLESISRKLEKLDKYLLVYVTPSKAYYDYADIPYTYRICGPNKLRGIDLLRKLIDGKDINFLDSKTVIDEKINNLPVFYPTGIHWARPIEQQMSFEIIEKLKEISGKNLRNIQLKDVIKNDKPYWRDSDVFDLLNLYSDANVSEYYEYKCFREYPVTYDKTRVLMQGGSFAEGWIHDYFDFYPNEEFHFSFYNQKVMSTDDPVYRKINTWEDWDLEFLDNVDFVVIELNEAAIFQYSLGFAEYLDAYLESYQPIDHKDNILKYSEILDSANQNALENSRGYHEFVNEYVWSSSGSYVVLENENIRENGMTIELEIPDDLENTNLDSIHIYVNQKRIDNFIESEKNGKIKIDIAPDEINDNNYYEIEIYSDSHIMDESGKELAVKVYYIGDYR